MRIDKYLWCIRLYKTRSLATEACRKNHIKLNGDHVKASKIVFIGEKLIVRKNQINYEIQVIDTPANRVGAKLVDLYRIDLTPQEEFEKIDLLKYSKDYYRKKGIGRPTKKDRRDLDDLHNEEDENED
ncbi:MAG: RNA-binding S4 domain-containing protein [Lutibacter sp.]